MIRQTAQARTPTRHRWSRFVVAVSALGLGLGTLATATAVPAGASGATTLRLVSHGSLGKILVNGAGMTVYIFTADGPNKPTCTGGCASAWPPVTVAKGAKPKGGSGVSHLGTVLSAGKLQVTWNHHPLYTYALDTKAGDVNGNGVKEGSGVWWAATAKQVHLTSSTTKTGSGSSGSSGYGY